MTITQLTIFSVIAERRSFTLAGIQLNISQSGVSHAIKSLEQELGVSLFHRHQGKVELTNIGVRLLQRTQMILSLTEIMKQEALDAKGMKRGILRIGSFGPTSSTALLPKILKEYSKKHPEIEVYIDEGSDKQVEQWIMDRKIDVGFVTLPEDKFETFPLIEDQMVAVLPKNHPLALKESISLKELCSYIFSLTEAGSGEIVSRMFLAEKLKPQIRYRTSQLVSTLAIVERGEAVTIVAESALPSERISNYIKRPLNPTVKRQVALAVIDTQQISPAAKSFITLASKIYRKIS
ncbi:LysR family transcriptional regulator [Xenorhabdus lircayensis]|uniref:LysR family transcriptional regulator n=1 Tax=Xenorhabdus lircayensis TaxID=2763499 RepID=A0ABS0U6C7_9GAMM|nr:LysR family transcriptional regulator [Xenorhabdus lircayensis]MBI6549431.1 LysR family transcriptional regulator [Xenorhabdus lircayensis]